MLSRRDGIPLLFALLALIPVEVMSQAAGSCELAVPGGLVVYGDDLDPQVISRSELEALPRVDFDGHFHDGRPARFAGMLLRDILVRAGAMPGRMRSGDLTRYAVVEAADGYRALFTLAELDPAFREAPPLLAYEQDEAPIRDGFGPLQVIVPGDQRQARWVRQVECVRIGRVARTGSPVRSPARSGGGSS
jgi:hypothetical protein